MDISAYEDEAASSEDPLLGELMHPRRKEYPSDFVAYFRKRFLQTLSIASHHHVVTFDVAGSREIVTGYAMWIRRHASDDERSARPVDLGEHVNYGFGDIIC